MVKVSPLKQVSQQVGAALCATLLIGLVAGCSTTAGSSAPKESQQTAEQKRKAKAASIVYRADDPLSAKITKAIEGDGLIFVKVSKEVAKTKQYKQTNRLARKYLLDHGEQLDKISATRALHFYRLRNPRVDLNLIKFLTQRDNETARRAGFRLASDYPSPKVRQFIGSYISLALIQNIEDKLYLDEVADAIAANRATDLYTFLRQGLLSTGGRPFAEAMAKLDSRRASDGFLNYLGLATLDDLRQLNQKTIKLDTAIYALGHLSSYLPDKDHDLVSHLYLYAVSRNTALRELAIPVLEKLMIIDDIAMAERLSRLPLEVQVAFVEHQRSNSKPVIGVFFSKLKTVTPHQEVIQDINGRKPR